MRRPDAEIGQIVRFDYLWRDEARRGRIEGSKDRPCAVILAMARDDDGAKLVYLAPITHSPPIPGQSTVEIPHHARELTGLDDARSWLVTSEVNRVNWLDPGIVPARRGQWLVGHLPRGIARRAVDQVLELARKRILGRVDRT